MEWSKIKNILIIALILINVLFLYMLTRPSEPEPENADSGVLLKDTLAVLEDNGITVRAETSFPEMQLPILTLNFDEDNGTFEYKATRENLYLNEDTAREEADRFLESLGSFGTLGKDIRVDSITLSEDDPDRFVVTYGGYYDDYRIKELYVACTVSSTGVRKMEKQWAEVKGSGRTQRSPIPVTTALLHYMDRVITEDPDARKEVTDISMTYTVNTPYDGTVTSDTAFPAWRIEAGDGSCEYIPAFQ